MAKSTISQLRSLSAVLTAAISLVLIGVQVVPAAAQSSIGCSVDHPCLSRQSVTATTRARRRPRRRVTSPSPTPTPTPTPTPSPTPTGAGSSGAIDRRARQSALQPDDHQPGARQRCCSASTNRSTAATASARSARRDRFRPAFTAARNSRPICRCWRASPTPNTAKADTASPARRSARSRCAMISSTGDRRGRSSTSAPSCRRSRRCATAAAT